MTITKLENICSLRTFLRKKCFLIINFNENVRNEIYLDYDMDYETNLILCVVVRFLVM